MNKRKSERDSIEESIVFDVVGQNRKINALLLDLSTTGMGFKSDSTLHYGDMLIGNLITWNRDKIQVVVKVIRDSKTNDGIVYGCTFVGMSASDKTKIEMYQKTRDN